MTRITYIIPPALIHIRGFGVAIPDLEGGHVRVYAFGDVQTLVLMHGDGPAARREDPLLAGAPVTGAQESPRSIGILCSKTHRCPQRGFDEKFAIKPISFGPV